ncbi:MULTISPECIES: alpha/beta fold hydrolase [Ramlibacter]|uniref:Alpha/beta fold hydrolase n=1 Tax=Ramlibacter pinisoli TaxID=2682844 RepID=A0A6N8J2U0_9BURK|nr:alpha/beta hydrolase [Ramlibacter sp. CGMCC 1.13660]MVQ32536.1 alpha/beta fold hydrolase [Ramlibacter pinisoli]
MIETFALALPHGITLSCRASGARGRPVLVFLHGFPEAAFVWDELLAHFARPEHGGFRCVAPNLRGFERSSAPAEVAAYRARHLVQDLAALVAAEGAPLECLVAHDWGGAVAWNLANQLPQLTRRLAIVNSPHPGAFLRELQSNPQQQQASAYMNFLIRPDAEQLLAEDDYRRLWAFFTQPHGAPWLTEAVKRRYRAVWDGAPGGPPGAGLRGGCNYYRASPLRPPRPGDPAAAAVSLPHEMLTVDLPTLVLWAMEDIALPPSLVEGLDAWVPRLTLERVPGATHWIVHERPAFVAERLAAFLARPL